ncbi:hypothetical protein JCM10213_005946 [Rhodosporidiobolus nylandii]
MSTADLSARERRPSGDIPFGGMAVAYSVQGGGQQSCWRAGAGGKADVGQNRLVQGRTGGETGFAAVQQGPAPLLPPQLRAQYFPLPGSFANPPPDAYYTAHRASYPLGNAYLPAGVAQAAPSPLYDPAAYGGQPAFPPSPGEQYSPYTFAQQQQRVPLPPTEDWQYPLPLAPASAPPAFATLPTAAVPSAVPSWPPAPQPPPTADPVPRRASLGLVAANPATAGESGVGGSGTLQAAISPAWFPVAESDSASPTGSSEAVTRPISSASAGSSRSVRRPRPTMSRSSSRGGGRRSSQLTRHPPPRSWLCPEEGCGKSFARPSALNSHSRTHSGDRPYICPCCARPFSVVYNLQRHMKTHPEIDCTNVRPRDIPLMHVPGNSTNADLPSGNSLQTALPTPLTPLSPLSPPTIATTSSFAAPPATRRIRGQESASSPPPPAKRKLSDVDPPPPDFFRTTRASDATPALPPSALPAAEAQAFAGFPPTPSSLSPTYADYADPQSLLAPQQVQQSLPQDTASPSTTVFVIPRHGTIGAPLSPIHEASTNVNAGQSAERCPSPLALPTPSSTGSGEKKALSAGEDLPRRSPPPQPIQMRRLQHPPVLGPVAVDSAPSYLAKNVEQNVEQSAYQEYTPPPHGFGPGTGEFDGYAGGYAFSASASAAPNSFYHAGLFQQQQQQQQYFNAEQPALFPPLYPSFARPPSPSESFRSSFARHLPQSSHRATVGPELDFTGIDPLASGDGQFLALPPSAADVPQTAAKEACPPAGGVGHQSQSQVDRARLQEGWESLRKTPPGVELTRRGDGGVCG